MVLVSGSLGARHPSLNLRLVHIFKSEIAFSFGQEIFKSLNEPYFFLNQENIQRLSKWPSYIYKYSQVHNTKTSCLFQKRTLWT